LRCCVALAIRPPHSDLMLLDKFWRHAGLLLRDDLITHHANVKNSK